MNKDELQYIKENYFEGGLDLNLLFEMINQIVTEEVGAPTVTPDEDINISLPVVKISEAWGRVGNSDRQIIEAFSKNVAGATLEAKLASINQVLKAETPSANISELLSTMMVCEILASILRDFTESAGGFIFEGFLAGLFGGQSVQITGPEDIGSGATGKPITDVILADRHYSLKLLGQTTVVKGSFRNMVEHFADYDHVIYLDARRIGGDQGLEFGEFLITLENFLDVFVTPFLKSVIVKGVSFETAEKLKEFLHELSQQGKPVKEIKFSTAKGPIEINGKYPKVITHFRAFDEPLTEELIKEIKVSGEQLNNALEVIMNTDSDTLQQFGPFIVSYTDEKFEGTKAQKLFGSVAVVDILKRNIETGNKDAIIASLRKTAGYTNKEQFEFTRPQAEAIFGFRTIGTLMMGEQHMRAVWANYAKILQEVINPIYSNLQEFTNNINAYLLGAEDSDRKMRGAQAINDARQLSDATSVVVKTVTPD